MAILFGRAQFTVVRGTRWEDDITLTDQASGDAVDLSSIVSLIMRVRESIDSDDVIMELSTDNARLTVQAPGTTGVLSIRVDSADMLDFPENDHEKARYVYDAIIERTAGEYEAAISGVIFVLPQVTRPWEP